jgi:hypothetical protein
VRRWTGLLLVLPLLVGCRDDHVRVAFRPKVGDVFRYEVTVRSRSEVRLPGERPAVRDEKVVLQSQHTVLTAGRNGVRVQVVLADASGSVRTFVVRFDRAAQLESVESDDRVSVAQGEGASGPSSSGAGVFGISEIFPAAAGAPPERRLGPGERWRVDDLISVPGSVGRAELTGEGRLEELGYVGDAAVARLATTIRLDLTSAQRTADGERVILDGVQTTKQRAAHDLADGAVRSAESTTSGTFALEIDPPVNRLGDPVHGTLTVRVRSTTKRLR